MGVDRIVAIQALGGGTDSGWTTDASPGPGHGLNPCSLRLAAALRRRAWYHHLACRTGEGGCWSDVIAAFVTVAEGAERQACRTKMAISIDRWNNK